MMLDTIKTTENNETRHCEEQCDEAIQRGKRLKLDCRARSRSLAMTRDRQRGNAMIYVLIALALFGFLTMTLSRSNDQADGQDIDDEQAELYALELIAYASSARQAVDMMLASGSEVNDLDFVIPSDPAFNTPPHYHKVYHPQGGGLNYQETFSEAIQTNTNSRWHMKRNSNVEWTPSNKNDVLLTALRISKKICENINEKITGSKIIPTLTDLLGTFFEINTGYFRTSSCPDCVGQANLCVLSSDNIHYGFYNIIAAQ